MPGALIEVHNILWMKYYNQIELLWVGINAHVIGAPCDNIGKRKSSLLLHPIHFFSVTSDNMGELTLHLGYVLYNYREKPSI
jgi:hypothetical protein